MTPVIQKERGRAYQAYLGGLNFLAVNAITWRCENWAFGQFFEAFKLLMVEADYPLAGEQPATAMGRFIDEKFPSLDRNNHRELIGVADAFESMRSPNCPQHTFSNILIWAFLSSTGSRQSKRVRRA
jgi:hypothetical protein